MSPSWTKSSNPNVLVYMTEQQQKVTCILYFNQLKNDKASGGRNHFTHYYAAYLYPHAQMDCLPKLDLVPTQVT